MLVTSRIAPTPSGLLHAGNGFNFVLTWLIVRKAGGTLHLRIDDLDSERARREYLEDIFETLDWLGIDWDDGPQSVAQVEEIYTQSYRMDRYHEALGILKQKDLLFACQKSRKELTQAGGGYPLEFRKQGLRLSDNDVAWRVQVPDPCPVAWTDHLAGLMQPDLYQEMPDFVVRRRDGIPAYQIASLCDDTDAGINLIVRGLDLAPSTAAQLFLAHCLDWTEFQETRFYHHPLLLSETGEKLSKSAGAAALRSWRKTHSSPDSFYAWVAGILDLPAREIKTPEELLDAFLPERLSAGLADLRLS